MSTHIIHFYEDKISLNCHQILIRCKIVYTAVCQNHETPVAGSSKLMTSLVNISLKFET